MRYAWSGVAVSALVLTFSCNVAECAENTRFSAPFGLRWGMKEVDLENMGLKGESSVSDLGFTQIIYKDFPNSPSKTQGIGVILTKNGLQYIKWRSELFEDDSFGSSGKKLYFDIKKSLTLKYNEAERYAEISGMSIYKKDSEFYECLSIKGCGGYISMWRVKGLTVSLKIEGLINGTGFIELVYTTDQQIEDEIEAEKNLTESDRSKF